MPNSSLTDDRNLINRCLAKDPEAWSILTARYSTLISVSIKSRLRKCGFNLGSPEIEDIKQDVLMALWKQALLEKVKNRRNISYWLSIVSGNIAIDHMRKKRREIPAYPTEDIAEELLISDNNNPIKALSDSETARRIESTIEKLPAKEKLVIKLNFLYGKKYEEISDILKLPAGTVSSYIKRAREKLKKDINKFLIILAIIFEFFTSYIVGT